MSGPRNHIVAQFDRHFMQLETGSAKKDNPRRQARLKAFGSYVMDAHWDDENTPLDAHGSVSLDVVFSDAEQARHGGTVTDLAGDGNTLEITLHHPETMLGWTQGILDSCSEQKPLTLHAHLPAEQEKRQGLNVLVDAVGRIADMTLDSTTLEHGDCVLINGLATS